MDATAWLALATFAAAVIGFVSAWMTTRKDRKALTETQAAVNQIHEKVGNGFAEEVLKALGEALGGIDALRIQVGIANSRINSHVKQHQQGVFAPKK